MSTYEKERRRLAAAERGTPLCIVEVDGLLDTYAQTGSDGYEDQINGVPVRLHDRHRTLLQRLSRCCDLLLVGTHDPAVLSGIAKWLGLTTCSTAQFDVAGATDWPPEELLDLSGRRRLVYLGWAPTDDDSDFEAGEDLIFAREPQLRPGDLAFIDEYKLRLGWVLPRHGWYTHENDFLDDCDDIEDAVVPSLPDWVVPAMRRVAPDRWSTDPSLTLLTDEGVTAAAMSPGAPHGLCMTLTAVHMSVRAVTPYWDLTVSKTYTKHAEDLDDDVSSLVWEVMSEDMDDPGHVPGRFVVVADLDREVALIVDATDVELESDAIRRAERGRWRGRLTPEHLQQLRTGGRPSGLVRDAGPPSPVTVESAVARRLEQCMADDGIVTFGSEQLYVQVKGGPGFLHVEAVSNRFLGRDARLSWRQRRDLESLGWSKPGELPNYVVQVVGDVDVQVTAELICRTLTTVYGLRDDEILPP